MTTFVFDTEIIGDKKPCFLVCCKDIETQQTYSFWGNKKAHRQDFTDLVLDPEHTWVSFNGIKFDAPLLAMWLYGHDEKTIKLMANRIIIDRMMPWDVYRSAQVEALDFDHIDLIEVAPGVMTSLKTYAGRINYPSMVDLPFEHDRDLKSKEKGVLVEYCMNDLGVTEALYNKLRSQIALREQLSNEHGIDLRSKSDAQVAEAILKKAVGINKSSKTIPPLSVRYRTPGFIKTNNKTLLDLIERIEEHDFEINRGNGSPELPKWLSKAPIALGDGIYQVGIGGLHSKHDKQFYVEASDTLMISDFDVASYYPSIMLECGLTPTMPMGKGALFLQAYREIYEQRLAAKRAGDKATADSLKISLNGTFGKLGSIYSALYTPDLMLAVTITGQLNLLCLIAEMVKIKGVQVASANTDGIMVTYPPAARDKVLKVIAQNSKRTGFEYEETPYRKVAMKDVNNYVAVTTGNKIKAKGLYADTGLMKNPTMPICSKAVQLYLLDGTLPEVTIRNDSQTFTDFTAIRNVKGGGEQAGVQLGRVVRWYMTTEDIFPIRYSSNGNLVPKTEGARACMVLPDGFPADLDYDWYIKEAYSMLNDMGVQL